MQIQSMVRIQVKYEFPDTRDGFSYVLSVDFRTGKLLQKLIKTLGKQTTNYYNIPGNLLIVKRFQPPHSS